MARSTHSALLKAAPWIFGHALLHARIGIIPRKRPSLRTWNLLLLSSTLTTIYYKSSHLAPGRPFEPAFDLERLRAERERPAPWTEVVPTGDFLVQELLPEPIRGVKSGQHSARKARGICLNAKYEENCGCKCDGLPVSHRLVENAHVSCKNNDVFSTNSPLWIVPLTRTLVENRGRA